MNIKDIEEFKDVTIKDDHLYLGDILVEDYLVSNHEGIFDKLEVRSYRNKNGDKTFQVSNFVCGLDLIPESGLYWLSGYPIKDLYRDQQQMSAPTALYESMDDIKRIFDTLHDRTVGKQWYISVDNNYYDTVNPNHIWTSNKPLKPIKS